MPVYGKMRGQEVTGLKRTSLLQGLRQIIQTFVEGYTTLNRRLWVLAIPIGLDLFLWLGPWISPQQASDSLAGAFQANAYLEAEQAAQAVTALREWGQQTNLTHVLSTLLLPALIPGLEAPATLGGYAQPYWMPAAAWVVTLIPLLGLALGLLLWSLYLLPLADLVRESGERGVIMLRRVPRVWWRMALLVVMVLLAGGLFLLVAGLLTLVAGLFSAGAAMLLLWASGAMVLWVTFYVYFTPSAILFSGVNPWRAMLYSAQVVRSGVWSSLGFILLSLVVRAGTVALWQHLAGHPVGVLAGILLNAYVVSGLAAAGLVFYRDRLRLLLAREKG